MDVSELRAVLLMISCFLALLTPCVIAEGGVNVLAANNREDVLLEVDVPLMQESQNNGTGNIEDIALSPDGKSYAYSTWGPNDVETGDETGYLVLCETLTGRILWKIKAHISGVYCLAFSPDSKLLATGSSDEHVKLWDAGNGKLLFDLTEHTHAVFDVEFSPDGKMLASCSADGTIRLWDSATGKSLASYVPAQDVEDHHDVICVAFTPDGKQIISSYHNNKTLCVWNIVERRLDASYTLPDYPRKIVVSRDGKRVACRGGFVWNLETGKLDPVFGEKFKSGVQDIATVSKDTSDFDLMILDTDGNIFGCDLSTGKTKRLSPPAK